eukprot:4933-Heterococcus_DN1.PRE.1
MPPATLSCSIRVSASPTPAAQREEAPHSWAPPQVRRCMAEGMNSESSTIAMTACWARKSSTST